MVITLEEAAKKPKIDDEEPFLSHFKQAFQAELTTMESMIRNLLLDVTNKEKEIRTLRDLREEARTKESEAITANNALAEKNEKMERKMAEVVEENQSLKEKIEELKREIEDQTRARKSEQATWISVREKMNSLETENMNKTEKIKSLEARFKNRNEKNALEAKEKIEKYRKQIADIEDKNKTQSKLISLKESEAQTLNDSLQKMEKIVDTISREKKELEIVLSKREKENDYLSQAKDELEKQHEGRKAELETEIAALTEKYKEVEQSEKEKETRILQLEKELQSSEENYEQQKTEIKENLEKKKNEVNKMKNEYENKIHSLKKELEELLEKSDSDWQHLKTIHRLENIIYNEKEENQEVPLVTLEPDQKVKIENKISETIAPVLRPRGRPKKNIVSVENDLNITYKEKEEQEDLLVTSKPVKKVETETEISGTITPIKRPRGRPKKSIASVEKELKRHLYKDSKITIRSI